MTTITEKNHSETQARAEMESIVEMVATLKKAEELEGNPDGEEEARIAIEESPLSVLVRTGWYSPGEPGEAEEYEILLCTGGPAVRIIGELNQHGEPKTARLEHQSWGTPWTEYRKAEEDVLLEYARCFYFGEG